jgi:putative heme-binding domain-containing protein
MHNPLVCLSLAVALASALSLSGQRFSPNVVSTDPLPPAKERLAFRLPPGFEAQLVAAEPDVHKPMNLAFDDQGRLWVTDTVEYPWPAKPGTKPRDTVKVLEDFGPDGRARKITTFAAGLNIPIGVLPLPGAKPRDALVFSIPNIYRLRDSAGTGKADSREALYGAYEVRDTHGMTSAFTHGFDGWVYACHGYANRSTIKGSDGRAITMHSGNTYRMKPDGSRLEQYTWGQVNPFGMALDERGNLYTADCHSQPIYQLLRGAYYPSFGKPHDGLGFGPETITNYRGSTAVCGIVYYAADHFPPAYQGAAFVGDVMTNQIVWFHLDWTGTTPRATPRVLLQSVDQWFRPVDIKLGPDGALYVADFYNRIIGHYEVPLTHPGRDRERGRIWRIVYTGKDHKGTPAPRQDWTKADVKGLVSDLAHPNLTVRLMATQQLAHRGGKAAVEPLRALLAAREPSPRGRAEAHALWVLERLGALDDDRLAKAAGHREALVRNHTMRLLASRPSLASGQRELVLAGLKDSDAHVRRAAADALGQHADAANLRALLDARHRAVDADTHLVHVIRMALRNQLRRAETWKAVEGQKWDEKDARTLADVALGVPSAEAAGWLLGHVKTNAYPTPRLADMVRHVARHGSDPVRRSLLAFARGDRPGDAARQAALFRALERGTQEGGAALSTAARDWGVGLTDRLLASTNGAEVILGVELTRVLRLETHQKKLVGMATGRDTPEPQRLAALDALAAINAVAHAKTLGGVLADAGLPINVREHAARLLAQANRSATRDQLLAALPAAPARLQNGIAAGLASSREGADKLLDAVAAGKASARLLQERAVVLALYAAKLPGLEVRLKKLTAGLPAADVKLAELVRTRRRGFQSAKADVARGAAVFEKHCANCHQIGGKGAKVGPQLDGIGLRGLDRLLEDTLDPNRNVDQAFRQTNLTLTSGRLVQGLLLREEGAVLVMADSQGKEVRVAKVDVEERSVSPLSPMPANVAEQVPEKEFYDLMAYLLTQRPSKP